MLNSRKCARWDTRRLPGTWRGTRCHLSMSMLPFFLVFPTGFDARLMPAQATVRTPDAKWVNEILQQSIVETLIIKALFGMVIH